MIPRYTPHIGLDGWFRWLLAPADRSASPEAFLAALAGGPPPAYHYAFDCLRSGLFVFFEQLAKTTPARSVLVSAQICAAVPNVIVKAGFTPQFVDTDASYPLPSAADYARALHGDVAAVIVAPLYGHIQHDWHALLAALGNRALVLDLAQGLGLAGRVRPLAARADAIGFSFGLGKGLDAGGGLVLTSKSLGVETARPASRLGCLRPLAEAAALRVIIGLGLYSVLARRLDREELQAQSVSAPRRIPDDIHLLWQQKLGAFHDDVRRAGDRAQQLGAGAAIMEKVRDANIYFSAASTHLRQVIRLRDSGMRDSVVARLRELGVDCAPAGEPLPPAAPGREPASAFPNARQFTSDAIRLPFLGRLTDAGFGRLQSTLERTLAEHIR
jgi:dTDP-4-amino-4,6-dideoxygalactose transaminase